MICLLFWFFYFNNVLQCSSPGPPHLTMIPSLPEFARSGHPEVITKDSMVERDTALLDAFISGFERSTTLFFGRIVSNPSDLPLFRDWLGYSMTYNGVPYSNGNAMHLHNSVEIFVALDGDFEIGYSNPGTTNNLRDSTLKDTVFTTVLKP